MRLYLDSFDFAAWDRLLPLALFYGVTTNPLLASRAGLNYKMIDWSDVIAKADQFDLSELHIQLPKVDDTALNFIETIEKANVAARVRVIIKVPFNAAGIGLVPQIQSAGFGTLMTACYHAKQMFVAQALGASYIAPYYGRMVEAGIDAAAHLRHMRLIGDTSETPCKLLIASIRSVDQMLELASDGHDMFTIAPEIADALLSDPHSDAAIEAFGQAIQ